MTTKPPSGLAALETGQDGQDMTDESTDDPIGDIASSTPSTTRRQGPALPSPAAMMAPAETTTPVPLSRRRPSAALDEQRRRRCRRRCRCRRRPPRSRGPGKRCPRPREETKTPSPVAAKTPAPLMGRDPSSRAAVNPAVVEERVVRRVPAAGDGAGLRAPWGPDEDVTLIARSSVLDGARRGVDQGGADRRRAARDLGVERRSSRSRSADQGARCSARRCWACRRSTAVGRPSSSRIWAMMTSSR